MVFRKSAKKKTANVMDKLFFLSYLTIQWYQSLPMAKMLFICTTQTTYLLDVPNPNDPVPFLVGYFILSHCINGYPWLPMVTTGYLFYKRLPMVTYGLKGYHWYPYIVTK